MLWIFAGLVWMSVFLNRISSKTERIVDTHVELTARISQLQSPENGGNTAVSNRDDNSIISYQNGVDEINNDNGVRKKKSRPLFPKNVIKKQKRSASILFY